MTPHKQLFRHDPANGVWGDCARTAIACMLDFHPSEVPHFCHGGRDDDAEVKREMCDYLDLYGYRLVSIPWTGTLDQVQAAMAMHAPGVHYMLMGESRNGVNHVVICKNGEIVHDPAIDNSGIVGPERDNNVFWVEFLAAKL